MEASVMPKDAHCWLGQAKPSVFTRLGAPRRLFTSRQGRTGAGANPPPDEAVEARRQAGQSCGERGLSRRWNVVRTLAAALDWTGPGWGQKRAPSSERREDEKEHEQKHMEVHEAFSLLEMRRRDRFLL